MSKKKNRDMLAKTGIKIVTDISPQGAVQEEIFDCTDNMVVTGPAGTGKTLLALYGALLDVAAGHFEKIVIVRSAVATRDIGYLPGNLAEKVSVFEEPYYSVLSLLTHRDDSYAILKKHGILNFITTSYVRGITLDDTVVVVDESQNMGQQELDSIITRVGRGSKIIFIGDTNSQCDLVNERSGFKSFIRILEATGYFEFFKLTEDDCMRSELVKAYLKARSASEAQSSKYLSSGDAGPR